MFIEIIEHPIMVYVLLTALFLVFTVGSLIIDWEEFSVPVLILFLPFALTVATLHVFDIRYDRTEYFLRFAPIYISWIAMATLLTFKINKCRKKKRLSKRMKS